MRGRTRETKGKENVRTSSMLARAGKTVARGLAVLGTVGIMGCAVAQKIPLSESRNLNAMYDSRQGDEMPQVMKRGNVVARVDDKTLYALSSMLGNYMWGAGGGGKFSQITTSSGAIVGTIKKAGASYEIIATDATFRKSVENLLLAKPVATVDSGAVHALSSMLGNYMWGAGGGGKFSQITTSRGAIVGTIKIVGNSYEIRATDLVFRKRIEGLLLAKPVATLDSGTINTLSTMLSNYGWASGKFSQITTSSGAIVGTIKKAGASYEIRAIDATFRKRLQTELQKIRKRRSIPRRTR